MKDDQPNPEPLAGLESVLVAAALAGAREVLGVYTSEFAVSMKSDQTPVCEADEKSEAAILAHLHGAFPGVPVVAEEACAAGRIPKTGRRFFLVDPLDGTKEFIRRNGEFTVNIALIEDGVPVAGIVLAPALRKAFVADGSAAWLGRVDEQGSEIAFGRSLRTRAAPEPPVAVASRSHSNAETQEILKTVAVSECVSIGSSLKFCVVAEGAADFYPRLAPTMEWDTAAGDAVLRAAGGSVVSTDGKPLVYGKASVAGMRPFENPHFMAVGDDRLMKKIVAKRAA